MTRKEQAAARYAKGLKVESVIKDIRRYFSHPDVRVTKLMLRVESVDGAKMTLFWPTEKAAQKE